MDKLTLNDMQQGFGSLIYQIKNLRISAIPKDSKYILRIYDMENYSGIFAKELKEEAREIFGEDFPVYEVTDREVGFYLTKMKKYFDKKDEEERVRNKARARPPRIPRTSRDFKFWKKEDRRQWWS